MIDAHRQVRRAAGALLLVLRAVDACPTCSAVAGCHAEFVSGAADVLRDAIHGVSPTTLRRASASLLWYLQTVKACSVCSAEEGCHRQAVDDASEQLRSRLQSTRRTS